jgi:hypothetical protein
VHVKEIKNVIEAYEGKYQTRIYSLGFSFQKYPKFYRFLRDCIDPKDNICNFQPKELAFVKAILNIPSLRK